MGKGPDPMTYDTDPATAGDTKPESTDDPEERVERLTEEIDENLGRPDRDDPGDRRQAGAQQHRPRGDGFGPWPRLAERWTR